MKRDTNQKAARTNILIFKRGKKVGQHTDQSLRRNKTKQTRKVCQTDLNQLFKSLHFRACSWCQLRVSSNQWKQLQALDKI